MAGKVVCCVCSCDGKGGRGVKQHWMLCDNCVFYKAWVVLDKLE